MMKSLPNQFTQASFSGAVATPTCSSSCCCCCCCVTTAIAGGAVSAYAVGQQGLKGKVSSDRRLKAMVTAALALPSAILFYLILPQVTPIALPTIVVAVLSFGVLFGMLTLAFSLVKMAKPEQKSLVYTLVLLLALIAEIGGGVALMLATSSIVAYFVAALLLSFGIIIFTVRRHR